MNNEKKNILGIEEPFTLSVFSLKKYLNESSLHSLTEYITPHHYLNSSDCPFLNFFSLLQLSKPPSDLSLSS